MNAKLYLGMFLSLVLLVAAGCSYLSPLPDRNKIVSCDQLDKSDLDFDPEVSFYTSDCKGYKPDEIDTVLKSLFASGKPVILFVHGRGTEPKKSLKGGGMIMRNFVKGKAVHKLEAQYNAKVLMFNWDSERGRGLRDRERPLRNMPASAENLHALLQLIKNYRYKNPNQPFVLLAHSMGTIVLQTVVEKYGWPSETPIFSNVVLSSSDADNLGHEKWVEKIGAIERTYITFNNDDGTLEKSTEARQLGANALGLNPGSRLGKNAKYINITGLGSPKEDKEENDHHELFNKCGMYKQVNVCHFYDSALKGIEPDLNDDVAEKNGQIYHLKSKEDKQHDVCFSNIQCDN